MSFPEEREERPDDVAPPPGMSTTMKVMLILGGIGAVCAIACCGGVVFFGAKLKNFVENATSKDPVKIRAATAEIVDIAVPPNFKPDVTVDFVFGKLCVYKDDHATLFLIESGDKLGNNPQQQRDEMQKIIQKQEKNADIQEIAREVRKFKIRGQEVEILFLTGTSRAGGAKIRQVSGAFPTKGGTGLLHLSMPEEKYSEETVVKMLESIK